MTFDSFYELTQLQALERHVIDTPACAESHDGSDPAAVATDRIGRSLCESTM